MSWQTGMVVRIGPDAMQVKVPTGADCAACHGKMSCTFQGPDKAYKTLEVPRLADTAVGDQVLVEEPASVLFVALLALLVWPVTLLFIGYTLAACCVQFRFSILVLSVSGIGLWVLGLLLANRWLGHSKRFEPRVRRSAAFAPDRQGPTSGER